MYSQNNLGVGVCGGAAGYNAKKIFIQLDTELWASEYQEGSSDNCNHAFAFLHTCIQVSRNEQGRG